MRNVIPQVRIRACVPARPEPIYLAETSPTVLSGRTFYSTVSMHIGSQEWLRWNCHSSHDSHQVTRITIVCYLSPKRHDVPRTFKRRVAGSVTESA